MVICMYCMSDHVRTAYLFFYAVTGCDTVSYFVVTTKQRNDSQRRQTSAQFPFSAAFDRGRPDLRRLVMTSHKNVAEESLDFF